MTHSIGDQFYRYLDTNHGIILDNYTVVGVTTCGVWLDVFGVRKFVLLSASKRYAAPTIEEAQVSFCFRKRRQIKLLTARLMPWPLHSEVNGAARASSFFKISGPSDASSRLLIRLASA
jgi:hypothetical protein